MSTNAVSSKKIYHLSDTTKRRICLRRFSSSVSRSTSIATTLTASRLWLERRRRSTSTVFGELPARRSSVEATSSACFADSLDRVEARKRSMKPSSQRLDTRFEVPPSVAREDVRAMMRFGDSARRPRCGIVRGLRQAPRLRLPPYKASIFLLLQTRVADAQPRVLLAPCAQVVAAHRPSRAVPFLEVERLVERPALED